MKDDPAPDQRLEAGLAGRIRAEREARGWSLADLAQRSGVSRAMISRIERAETSPTAVLLSRLAGAFAMTLSALLARAEADAEGHARLMRVEDQPSWQDPATGYVRRTLSPPGMTPELVRVELPPGARVEFPALAHSGIAGQCVWMLSGTLDFLEGPSRHRLQAGDCLALADPTACVFANPSVQEPAIYLVAVTARR
jgi:transcriptional regulator with XRE-family HTH domain